MKNIHTFVFAITLMSTNLVGALELSSQKKHMEAMSEMKSLVAAESPARKYLYCAVLSSNLDMMDMYGLFVRKTFELTKNPDTFVLALSYMMGYFENELLHLKGELNSKQLGEVLASQYSNQCLKIALTK